MAGRKSCTANCELFGKYASYFESHVVPLWGGAYDSLVGGSGVRAGDRVLDVGTGTGEVALRTGRLVGKRGLVVGIDTEDEMLNIARRKSESQGSTNVQFRRTSAEEIDLPDSSFDAAVGNYSLCCCSDYEAALSECLRVLKPGGRLTYNHSGTGDPAEFELAFQAFEKYKTKRPSKRLAEIRDADAAQKEAFERFRDPSAALGALRKLGYANAEASIVRREIRYKDSGAFIDRLLGFSWRNEADEVSSSDLKSFRTEATEALRQLHKGKEFTVADDMVFFTGLKP